MCIRDSNNTPALGYNSNSISYFLIFQNPNVNLDWLRPMWRTGQENVKQLQPYSSFIGNPYVILYESENPSEKHSNVSSVSANLRINSKFDFMIRSGIQLSSDQREQHLSLIHILRQCTHHTVCRTFHNRIRKIVAGTHFLRFCLRQLCLGSQ